MNYPEIKDPDLQLDISLRESRMVVERLLMQTGMSKGAIPAVREAVIVSEALGLGGYARLMALHPTMAATTTEGLQVLVESNERIEVDAARAHAWAVAQGLVDLIACSARAGGASRLIVRNLDDAGEIAVAVSLAARTGVQLTVEREPEGSTTAISLTVTSTDRPPADGTDALLWRVIREGLRVPATVWWTLYQRSLSALAVDSVVSRRHAGANVVDDSGRVLGRMTDDDTDFSLLRNPSPAHKGASK